MVEAQVHRIVVFSNGSFHCASPKKWISFIDCVILLQILVLVTLRSYDTQHTDYPSLIAKAILSSLLGAYCYVSVLDSSMQYCSVALRQQSNIERSLRKAKRSFVHCSKIATGCGDRHAGTSLPRFCTPLECILLEGPFIRQSTVRRVTVCRFR